MRVSTRTPPLRAAACVDTDPKRRVGVSPGEGDF